MREIFYSDLFVKIIIDQIVPIGIGPIRHSSFSKKICKL